MNPKLVNFEKIGNPMEGYISVSDNKDTTGFEVKRVFWTYATPSNLSRGRHAHYETEMILIAVNGEIEVNTIDCYGQNATYKLTDPNVGLHLPSLCWHEMFYSKDAVQLVLCSTEYKEEDYIRSKDQFEELIKESSNE